VTPSPVPDPTPASPLALRFTCSICGDPSGEICHACTKDSCPNHLCTRCLCCSDCCRCEVSLANDPHVSGPAHLTNGE
jgi:hypothetical protein